MIRSKSSSIPGLCLLVVANGCGPGALTELEIDQQSQALYERQGRNLQSFRAETLVTLLEAGITEQKGALSPMLPGPLEFAGFRVDPGVAAVSDPALLPWVGFVVTPVGGSPMLPEYDVQVRTTPGGDLEPLCPAAHAVIAPGLWYPDGHPESRPDMFTFACRSAVLGKCLNWGYNPTELGTQGDPGDKLLLSCTRFARADYCGEGKSYTIGGTPVEFWDSLVVNAPTARPAPGMQFEAAWKIDGTPYCLSQRRWQSIPLRACKSDPRLGDDQAPHVCESAPGCRVSRQDSTKSKTQTCRAGELQNLSYAVDAGLWRWEEPTAEVRFLTTTEGFYAPSTKHHEPPLGNARWTNAEFEGVIYGPGFPQAQLVSFNMPGSKCAVALYRYPDNPQSENYFTGTSLPKAWANSANPGEHIGWVLRPDCPDSSDESLSATEKRPSTAVPLWSYVNATEQYLTTTGAPPPGFKPLRLEGHVLLKTP